MQGRCLNVEHLTLNVHGFCRSTSHFHVCIFAELFEHGRLAVGVDQRIHCVKTFEGILTIEDARFVGIAIFGKEDAPTETAVDGRAADEDGNFMSTALHFVDDERHLLGGRYQQSGQTNRGGVRFHSFGDNRLRWHLLAEVNDCVAVVGKNRLDQILADVMHVAVNRGDDDRAFGDAFHFLKIILKMGDGLLHGLSGLQHEGQNQLTSAEFVADFFHGREEHCVEGVDSDFVFGGMLFPSPFGRG